MKLTCDGMFEQYGLIFEHLGTFAVLNREGRYVYVNKAWAHNRGLAVENSIGRHVRDIFPHTRAIEAMNSGRPILAHPIMINERTKEKQFTSYLPIFHGGEVVGCIIQTIFHDVMQAMQFSERFEAVLHERDFYRQELRRLRGAKYSIDNIVGNSQPLMKVKRQIRQAARSVSNVLIEGETGVGKELVAHSIHQLSSRADRPFVKINCSAIPYELAEAELFGYEHGAFTGAKQGGKIGKFEMAGGGGLFLDEINQLSPAIQPKLLRVLQEREVERVGGSKSIRVDARVIAATNTALERLVESGLFRGDLYYRLNVMYIRVPPLRERLEDIPAVCAGIIERLNEQLGTGVEDAAPDVIGRFQEYHWPGNIRELQNVLERAMNERLRGVLHWEDCADYFVRRGREDGGGARLRSESFRRVKKEMESALIAKTLKETKNNRRKAAQILGISRTMLYRKLKEFGLE